MGFRQGVLLATTCFLFGVLLACFAIDYRVLFSTLTEETVEDAFQYYRTFYNAPPGIKALLHALMGIGVVAIVAKIHRWDESAMFFDGGSLAAFVFAISMYITVTIPAIQTVVIPIEALRVLSAGNTLIMLLLGGILVLQGGQEWARRLEAKELAKIAAEEAKEKKDL
ncbi:Shr3 amino acid permease chaperone [Lactarius hengduanensis]|nr:Shr3 amino acid permease chaperone [Lactarius hengduanensis]